MLTLNTENHKIHLCKMYFVILNLLLIICKNIKNIKIKYK